MYADTGIELNMIRDFVLDMQKSDDRIKVIKPSVSIKAMLEKEGYPFKSKRHAKWVATYQRRGMDRTIHNYLHDDERDKNLFQPCPNILKYQFTEDFSLKISDKCCLRMKEDPLVAWQKEYGKSIAMVGIMREEGGAQRECALPNISKRQIEGFSAIGCRDKRVGRLVH